MSRILLQCISGRVQILLWGCGPASPSASIICVGGNLVLLVRSGPVIPYLGGPFHMGGIKAQF